MASSSMQYKEGLVGSWSDGQFDSIVTSYCERIKNDGSLAQFFDELDMESLKDLQNKLLLAAFLEQSDDSVYLRFCKLINEGLDGNHFDSLLMHFYLALVDCAIDENVFATCKLYLNETRYTCETSCEQGKIEEKPHANHGGCPMCVVRPSKKEPKSKNKLKSMFRKRR